MTHSPSPGRDANIDKDFELYMSHEHVWVTQLIWWSDFVVAGL